MSFLEALADLECALEYNTIEFDADSIDKVDAYILGEHDGPNWEWIVTLTDGTKWYVMGGCDYTGWDCQSGLEATRLENHAALLRVVTENSRAPQELFVMLDKGAN